MQWGVIKNGEITDVLGFVYGAGAVYRKSAITELKEKGFKFFLTDRIGKELVGGGDIELSRALRLAGWKIWYEVRLIFKHFIPKSRLTWQYIKRLVVGTGASMVMLKPYDYMLNQDKTAEYKMTYWYQTLVYLFFLIAFRFPALLKASLPNSILVYIHYLY
jgi:hypothetical protein